MSGEPAPMELVVARAIDPAAFQAGRWPDENPLSPWFVRQQGALSCARAALAAIEASGTHRVAPVVANEEMRKSGTEVAIDPDTSLWRDEAAAIWTAMITSAPKVG